MVYTCLVAKGREPHLITKYIGGNMKKWNVVLVSMFVLGLVSLVSVSSFADNTCSWKNQQCEGLGGNFNKVQIDPTSAWWSCTYVDANGNEHTFGTDTGGTECSTGGD